MSRYDAHNLYQEYQRDVTKYRDLISKYRKEGDKLSVDDYQAKVIATQRCMRLLVKEFNLKFQE